MKTKNVLIIFLLVLFTQIASAVTGEYIFEIYNPPSWYTGGLAPIYIYAVSDTIVYNENFDPVQQYQTATDELNWPETIGHFDWFNDDDGNPLLAYSIYKISIDGTFFYINFYDCYYGNSIYPEDPQYTYTNPSLDVHFEYDFATGQFKYEDQYEIWHTITNGQTIIIWEFRDDYPCQPQQECFNPKVLLKNKYETHEDFGRLVVDDTKFVESGQYAWGEENTTHEFKPEEQKYSDIGGDNVQHHHWENVLQGTSTNYFISDNFTIQ